MNNPVQIWGSTDGLLYVADVNNDRVRVFNYVTSPSSSLMTTVAGTGSDGPAGDQGRATSASVHEPTGVSALVLFH